MTDKERLILTLVLTHDKQWHWYHLDRNLKTHGFPADDLMEIIKRFDEQGLLECHQGPNHVVYSVTEKGKQALS